jgi:hypothetical protein
MWLGCANASKSVVEEAGRTDFLSDGAERYEARRSARGICVAESSFMRLAEALGESEIEFRRQ